MLAGLSTQWKKSNNFHGLRNKPFKENCIIADMAFLEASNNLLPRVMKTLNLIVNSSPPPTPAILTESFIHDS